MAFPGPLERSGPPRFRVKMMAHTNLGYASQGSQVLSHGADNASLELDVPEQTTPALTWTCQAWAAMPERTTPTLSCTYQT